MPFEVFTHASTRSPKKGATVTLNSRGGFSLNADAYELLDGPSHVELLFDAETQTVAFRPVGEDSASAYPVRQQGKSFLFSGTAFARFHGIDLSVGRRWPVRFEDGMLQFNLADATEVTSNRKKRP